MKPLKKCANGCEAPPKLPSLVICEKCQNKITKTLEELATGLRPSGELVKEMT